MDKNTTQIGYREWLVWVLASAAGMAAGGLLCFLVLQGLMRLVSSLNEDRVFIFILLPCLGMGLGMSQWLVLRQRIPQAWRWIAVSMVGFAASLLVFYGYGYVQLLDEGQAPAWLDPVFLPAVGAVVGLAQWLVLRQSYSGMGLWVLASAIGFLGALWLFFYPVTTAAGGIGFLALLGALLGAVTGLLWMRLQLGHDKRLQGA